MVGTARTRLTGRRRGTTTSDDSDASSHSRRRCHQWAACDSMSFLPTQNKSLFCQIPTCRYLKKCLHKRQCQIRVQFESVGMQFFKVLKKWFWMTKYVPIIVLWCSEGGFYKMQKSHLTTCFRRFTSAPNHLAVYVRILGQVGFGKNSKSCQYWHWIFRVLH